MIFLGTGTQCEEESNYDFQVPPPPKHIRPWAGERRQLRQSGHLQARWAEPLGQGWPERVGWRSRRWACPGHGPGRVAASPCPGPAPRPGSLFQGCGRVTAQTWGHPALILWGLGHLCQVEKDRREQAAAPPGLCVERPVRRAGRVRLRDDTPSTEPPRERPGRGRGRRRLSALPTPRPLVPSDRERDRLCPTPGGAAATRAPGSRAR